MKCGGRKECAAGVEPHSRDIEPNLIECARQISCRRDDDPVAAAELGRVRVVSVVAGRGGGIEAQDDGRSAVVQIVEDMRIGIGRIGGDVLLADVPAAYRVAHNLRAARERRKSWQSHRIAARRERLLGVDRLQLDAFIGARNHFLLERCALQVDFDSLAPGCVVDLGEFALEGKFLGDHAWDLSRSVCCAAIHTCSSSMSVPLKSLG